MTKRKRKPRSIPEKKTTHCTSSSLAKLGEREATKKYGNSSRIKSSNVRSCPTLQKELRSICDGGPIPSPSSTTLIQSFLKKREKRLDVKRKLQCDDPDIVSTSRSSNEECSVESQGQPTACDGAVSTTRGSIAGPLLDNSESNSNSESKPTVPARQKSDSEDSSAVDEAIVSSVAAFGPSTSRDSGTVLKCQESLSREGPSTRCRKLNRTTESLLGLKEDGPELNSDRHVTYERTEQRRISVRPTDKQVTRKTEFFETEINDFVSQANSEPVLPFERTLKEGERGDDESDHANKFPAEDYRSAPVDDSTEKIRPVDPQSNLDIDSYHWINYYGRQESLEAHSSPNSFDSRTHNEEVPGSIDGTSGEIKQALPEARTNSTVPVTWAETTVAPGLSYTSLVLPDKQAPIHDTASTSKKTLQLALSGDKPSEKCYVGSDVQVIAKNWANGVKGFHTPSTSNKEGLEGEVAATETGPGENTLNTYQSDRVCYPSLQQRPEHEPEAEGEITCLYHPLLQSSPQPRSHPKKSNNKKKKSKKSRAESDVDTPEGHKVNERKSERIARWRIVPPRNVIVTRRKAQSQEPNDLDPINAQSLKSFDLFPQLPESSQRKRKHEEDRALLNDWGLDRYACALWSSDNRRRILQMRSATKASTPVDSNEVDEILRGAWEDLAESEKLRYYRRARSAITDREKGRGGYTIQLRELTRTSLQCLGTTKALNMTLSEFQTLSAEKKDIVIGVRMRRIQARTTMDSFETLMTFFSHVMTSEQTSYEHSSCLQHSATRVLTRCVMIEKSKQVLFDAILKIEKRLAEFEVKRVEAKKRSLMIEYDQILAKLIMGFPASTRDVPSTSSAPQVTVSKPPETRPVVEGSSQQTLNDLCDILADEYGELSDQPKEQANTASRESNAVSRESIAASREIKTASRETNAASRETNAASRETNAASRETNAASRDTNAASRETNAASRETNAASRETNTASRETNAASREANADTYATHVTAGAVDAEMLENADLRVQEGCTDGDYITFKRLLAKCTQSLYPRDDAKPVHIADMVARYLKIVMTAVPPSENIEMFYRPFSNTVDTSLNSERIAYYFDNNHGIDGGRTTCQNWPPPYFAASPAASTGKNPLQAPKSRAYRPRDYNMTIGGEKVTVPGPANRAKFNTILKETAKTRASEFLEGPEMGQVLADMQETSPQDEADGLQNSNMTQGLPHYFRVDGTDVTGPTDFLTTLLLEDHNKPN